MLEWNLGCTTQEFEPGQGILGNVVRQGEEVRVREKCGGFVLVVKGVSIAHRPF